VIVDLVILVVVIVAADAIWARCRIRLRTRAAHAATKRPGHELSHGEPAEGRRTLEDIQREFETGVAADDENPFTRLGRSSRRGR
jgi:hypothetical protein